MWRVARKMRLNPYKVRLNIETNIETNIPTGRGRMGQMGGAGEWGPEWGVGDQNKHHSRGSMGQMGGWGVTGGKGGVEAPSGIPSPLSGIPSPSWYPIPLTSHQSGILHSLIFLFSYLHCFCIANAKYKGIVSSNNLQILFS